MTDRASQKQISGALLLVSCTPALAACLSWAWARTVNNIVKEPYLDEVFHVPQAQEYCAGNWKHWDPKITTPPGLYIISWLAAQAGLLDCSTRDLRSINGFLWFWAYISLAQICHSQAKGRAGFQDLVQRTHGVLNICLFPCIFFFSGLYYTDVASTATVLAAVGYFYEYQAGFGFFIIGLASLFFRQTNIFWVALFPAGLTLVSELRRQPGLDLFDPPVRRASAADYAKTISSIFANLYKLSARSLRDTDVLSALIRRFWPFAALLTLFAGFIAWNGSVVLGDKSNHVATVHLPQVLYLFAYISFFSFPIMAPALLATLVPQSFRPRFLSRFACRVRITSLLVAALIIVGFALPAIHFNTIIHPFTLADNRHYVFYVFRILRLHPVLRYAAAPVYIVLGWALVQILGLPQMSGSDSVQQQKDNKQSGEASNEDEVHVSYVLVWLAVSALCLVSAPLVEPRYFVLPWIFWRIRIPHLSTSPTVAQDNVEKDSFTWSWAGLLHPDYRLYLETIWFLTINAATAYMFLFRGFGWPQEPGNMQRFLW